MRGGTIQFLKTVGQKVKNCHRLLLEKDETRPMWGRTNNFFNFKTMSVEKVKRVETYRILVEKDETCHLYNCTSRLCRDQKCQ